MPIKNWVPFTSQWSLLAFWCLVCSGILVLPLPLKLLFNIIVSSFSDLMPLIMIISLVSLLCLFALFIMALTLCGLGFRVAHSVYKVDESHFELLTYSGKKIVFLSNDLELREPIYYKVKVLKWFYSHYMNNFFLRRCNLYVLVNMGKEYYVPIDRNLNIVNS